ncbi:hypothetical protein GCM10007859_11290 [Brevundimonas denitrificans]|uniref:DUF1330 domain-containing protein n=1 Tax=Brevundimonas denitrificans TaxID=1443434 RepID=A0ABQ6BGQ5_9CAUL|nr:DUF1330 domain-containing protein [Brevundimonas denitrificans]GLS01118.1 hypothetical protein GCM10007859_11290 [Brevundimonas denitrificans]
MIHGSIAPLAVLALLTFSVPAGAQTAPTAVARAYIINEITVTDPTAYAEYVRRAPAVVAAFGGRYIVRAGAVTPMIGEPPTARIVVVEFPSHQAAADFLASPEYQAILPIRQAASTSRAYVVDGVAP